MEQIITKQMGRESTQRGLRLHDKLKKTAQDRAGLQHIRELDHEIASRILVDQKSRVRASKYIGACTELSGQ